MAALAFLRMAQATNTGNFPKIRTTELYISSDESTLTERGIKSR